MAYSKLEPWGEAAEHKRLATLMAFIGNMFRGKNDRLLKPDDFLAGPQGQPRQSVKQMVSILNHWARMHNASRHRRRGG